MKPMRKITKALVLAAALLAAGISCSSISANSLPVGAFTLRHATQLNGTTLPAGEYQFKMTRTQTDANMLVITGQKQTINVLVPSQAACDSCKNEALKMKVQGDTRIITAMDLPGYHVDFKTPRAEGAQEAANDASAWVEQVAVHVTPAN